MTSQPTVTATPTTAEPRSRAAQPASVGLHRQFVSELSSGQLTGTTATDDGQSIALAKDSQGRYHSQGEVVGPEWTTETEFNNLVLSWNASVPAAASLTLAVRVQSDGRWSDWYTMGVWRNGQGASVKGQSNSLGSVNVDTLVLNRPAQVWQARGTLTTTDTGQTPTLRSVTVATADTRQAPSGPPVTVADGWLRDLEVPRESQAIQDPSVAWEICSPTSLTMILRYWGANVTLPQLYGGVRDTTTGIYGNWPLNTAYAGQLGFDAYVARLYSLDQVKNEIAAGHPVILSIKYQPGELAGAPLASTSGHIILVRGFAEGGKVIVNDPAAPGVDSVRRVLRADQLEKVWLRSGGIAYIISPGQ
ncbi:MAG: peptidase C39 family protein [Dehalococcoidales bacterium]|nr:peptidase C39 family protein [Dehalococcoidales bacterium]